MAFCSADSPRSKSILCLVSRWRRMKVESAISSASSLMYGSLPFGALRKPLRLISIGQLGHLQQDFGLGDERARVGQAKLRSECVERDHRPAPCRRGHCASNKAIQSGAIKNRRTRRPRRQCSGLHDAHAALRDEPERQRIDAMLDREHARGERLGACRPSAPAPRACAMIGPASISGTTKCTVAPWVLTPAASARPCGVEALETPAAAPGGC